MLLVLVAIGSPLAALLMSATSMEVLDAVDGLRECWLLPVCFSLKLAAIDCWQTTVNILDFTIFVFQE